MLDETDKGRRVELIHTVDGYTKLKPGDKGTYQFKLKDQHVIKWDEGSSLILLEGVDKFKFIPCELCEDKCPDEREKQRALRSVDAE